MKTSLSATLLLLLCTASISFAQTQQRPSTNIGFIYPLSTNGLYAAEASNRFSLNVLAGVSKNEDAFCVAGVANFIRDTANGAIIAGVINITGKSATGLQAAGLMNIAPKTSDGLMAAGFMNIAGQHKGLMAAGFGNIATVNVDGLQAAGFMNIAHSATVQTAGFINISKGKDTGMHIGFAQNSKRTKAQIAGYINVADEVEGIQIAGMINVAKKVKGVQLAGFINIADSSDCPIGFINIIKNGEKSIGLNMDETGTGIVAFRSGGRKLYGIIGMGARLRPNNSLFAMQTGLGANMHVSRYFRFKVEATAVTLRGNGGLRYVNTSLRFLPAIKIGCIEAFAGPGINSMYNNRGLDNDLASRSLFHVRRNGYTHDVHIGFTAGIQFHF